MDHRHLAPLLTGIALASLSVPVVGQTQTGAADIPRLADGRPDLRGVWDFRTLTPLQRPTELADKGFFTEEEAAEFVSRQVRESNVDLKREKTVTPTQVVNGTTDTVDLMWGYNNFWFDFGTTVVETRRTSLVIDPPDGRIPQLTPVAQERVARREALNRRIAEGPEDRSLGERCIVRPSAGPPIVPRAYNNNVQLFQTPGYLVILSEEIHDARIVPMDGRAHLPSHLRQWMGDSRGHWEGDTLVVETTNFNDEKYFLGAGQGMQLIERFARVDETTLNYEFTVSDPESFTRPWTAQIPMRKSLDPIYEYACHEGNYGMEGTLRGARAVERNTPR